MLPRGYDLMPGVLKRRRLLTAAIALPSLAAFTTPTTPYLLRAGTALKIRGIDMYGPQWPYWAYFWNNFGSLWSSYIQVGINAAATSGANCIKITCPGVSDSSGSAPSSASLNSNIALFCQYAASKGLLVYGQIAYAPSNQFSTNGSTVSTGTAAAQVVANAFNSQPNCIGIDCCNEVDVNRPASWSGQGSTSGSAPFPGNPVQMYADLTTYVTGISQATSKPLTLSVNDPSATKQFFFFGVTSGVPVAPFVPLLSFHDLHYYYYNNANNAPAFDATLGGAVPTLVAEAWYKGLFILGETGSPLSQGQTAQAAWATAVPGMTNAQSTSAGAVWWVGADTYGTPGAAFTDSFGMYTQNWGSSRSYLTTPFATWPHKP